MFAHFSNEVLLLLQTKTRVWNELHLADNPGPVHYSFIFMFIFMFSVGVD